MTDNSGYSARFIRFVLVPWHSEAYQAAYLDQSQSSSNELQRLTREYATLPPKHSCSCRPEGCYAFIRWGYACPECSRLRANEVHKPEPIEIGRSAPVEPPMPMTLLLDLARAMSVLGAPQGPQNVARWLSGQLA